MVAAGNGGFNHAVIVRSKLALCVRSVFNYFPLYNKFRAVESILAVASICFPILALLAIQEIITSTDKTASLKTKACFLYYRRPDPGIDVLCRSLFLSFKSSEVQHGHYLSYTRPSRRQYNGKQRCVML